MKVPLLKYVCYKGFKPFIELTLRRLCGERWVAVAHEAVGLPLNITTTNIDHFDTRYLLMLIIKLWNEVK